MKPTGRGRWILGLVAGLALVASAGAAGAQNQDIKPLLDRIDRLERDVNMLQRQVYRGTSPSGTPMAVSPPDSQSSLSNEVRIGQLEEQMRTMTGQLEEVNYAIDQLKHRLDTLSNDVDARLTALEHGGSPAAAGAVGAGNAETAQTSAPGAAPKGNAGEPGVLGTLREPASGTASTQTAAAPATLPSGTPQEQYNDAFGLLRRADYPAAEQALKAFIRQFPSDPLAGNAQYWLGETYYVRKDYQDAATAFAVGYQKYPNGGKAADNLLKLGMSLGNLGKKGEACAAFTRLDRDYPTAPANLKDRLASERKQLGC